MNLGAIQTEQSILIRASTVVSNQSTDNKLQQHAILKEKLKTANKAYLTNFFRIRNEERMVDSVFLTSSV